MISMTSFNRNGTSACRAKQIFFNNIGLTCNFAEVLFLISFPNFTTITYTNSVVGASRKILGYTAFSVASDAQKFEKPVGFPLQI
jgi:hypothetical protein